MAEAKTADFDILVVGGSGAAMMSAISAKRKGCSVGVVSKGKVGKSGNAIMIGGGFGIDGQSAHDICGEAAANQNYTKDMLYESVVKSSFYLSDQRLARQYVQRGGEGVKECLGWARNAAAKFFFIPPASLWNTSGRHFGMALGQSRKDNPGIAVFEDTVITDLLKSEDGRVCGAVGVDVYSGEIVEFHAKAVVLATGGIQLFSLKNSISDMTGDGVAMALRAGAQAVDMEYYLFIPTALEPAYIKGSIIPYLMTIPVNFPLVPRVLDMDGQELGIDEKYRTIPATSKMNKIMYAYFWGRGVEAKREKYGNVMYFDYSRYSDEEIKAGFDKFISQASNWYPKGYYNGIDLNDLCSYLLGHGKRLKVGFGNEYSQGGVAVDAGMATRVPGLFAAGEVTGGVFGAFRSADGITEMLAHGLAAGESAAAYASGHETAPACNASYIVKKLLAPLSGQEGAKPFEVIRQLEELCDDGLNFFRDQKRIDSAMERLLVLEKSLPSMSASSTDRRYNLEWLAAIQAENLLLCAKAGLIAASERKESRGTHMRSDFPRTDNHNYLCNYRFSMNGTELLAEKTIPLAVDIPLPAEDFEGIPDFVLQTTEGR